MAIQKVTLPDGSIRWEAYVRSGGRGSPQIRRRFETKVEAEHFEVQFSADKQKQIRLGEGIEDFLDTTFQEEADFWLRTRGPEMSPAYLKRFREILAEVLPVCGPLKPLQLHFGRLTEIRTDLRSRKAVKAASLNRMTNVITAILRHSAENRRIPYNPAAGFKRLKEEKKEVRFWEASEASRFLAFANDKYPADDPSKRWVYVVYLVALNTGLRAGEIWGLTPKALLRNSRELHIFQQFDAVAKKTRPLKDKEERVVPCNEELRKELLLQIERMKVGKDDLIFRNKAGKFVCHNNFRNRHFEIDIRKCPDVREMTFHNLRDTAATLMISRGVDIITVQKILGHEDVSTTMRYAHALKDSIRNVAATFSVLPEATAPTPISGLRLVR